MKKLLLAPVAIAVLALSPQVAQAATMTHSGTITAYVSPPQALKGTGPIFVTGLIGDYGTTTNQNAAGAYTMDWARVSLTKGGFEVNVKALNAAGQMIHPQFYPATCEYYGNQVGTAPVSGGTGAYAGITGTLTIHVSFVGVVARLANGKCNMSQNAPNTHQTQVVIATGHVTY